VSAFGDGLLRAFGVHAKRADEKRPAPVDVQALAEPAQEHAVAACRGSDPYRFDVATHDEHTMTCGAGRRHGLGVELSGVILGHLHEDRLRRPPADRLQRLAGREHAREARQPQRRDDRAVGLEQVVLRQVVGPCPGERLGLERLRLALVVGDLPDIEQYAPLGVCVPQPDERPGGAHGDPELLGELALQACERLLAGGQFAAREFPAPGHVTAARTLRDQDTPVSIGDSAGNDMDLDRDFQPWPPRAGRGKFNFQRTATPRGSA
jgi:hypothetical protein